MMNQKSTATSKRIQDELQRMITHDRLIQLLQYNERTGLFIWRDTQTIADKGLEGYRRLVVDSKSYLSHHLAWYYMNKEWREDIIHVNKNKGDNSIDNLRV